MDHIDSTHMQLFAAAMVRIRLMSFRGALDMVRYSFTGAL